MKAFERIIKNELLLQVQKYLDLMQFGYRTDRGVEDPLLFVLYINDCRSIYPN